MDREGAVIKERTANMPKTHPNYGSDFQMEAVNLLLSSGRPLKRVAEELGVSLRTLYRDIATLQAQGAAIEGEAGLGYVLRPGFFLPPLRFSEDEMDALLLGLRFVAQRGDPGWQANLVKSRKYKENGGPDTIRTYDLCLRRAAFYAFREFSRNGARFLGG